jgi:hypothetical protein
VKGRRLLELQIAGIAPINYAFINSENWMDGDAE